MKKRRNFSIKLKKTKKNKNIVLLVIASIAATVGTAVFGMLKWKGKKNAHDESKETAETTLSKESSAPKGSVTSEAPSASNEAVAPKPKPPARFAHRKLQPGELDWEQLAKEKEAEQIRRGEIPEHMLADVEKPPRGIRRRNWKIALSGIATLLAVAVVSSNIAQYLRPSEAMAKESFAGIGKIVAEHDEGNPYKILNIVPVKAQWSISELSDNAVSDDVADDDTNDDALDDSASSDDTSNDNTSNDDVTALKNFTFSTGTMGYLAGGKVPFSDELETALRGNPVFKHYASREELINKLIPESSINAFPWIKYEEAYGGVHSVSEVNGWTLLFDYQSVDQKEDGSFEISSSEKSKMSDGTFTGTAIQYQEGADKTGYDFISYDGSTSTSSFRTSDLSGKVVYIYYGEEDGDEPPHWYPVSLEEYYEKFQPNDVPAWMFDPDGVTMITIGENGPNCGAGDYVYKFNGESFSPVGMAEKVEELYYRVVTPETSGEETQQTESSGVDSTEADTEQSGEEDAPMLNVKNTIFTNSWRKLASEDPDIQGQSQGQSGQEQEGQEQGQESQEQEGQEQGQEGQEQEGQEQDQEGQEQEGQEQGQEGQEQEGQEQGQEGQEQEDQEQGQESQEQEGQEQGQEGQNQEDLNQPTPEEPDTSNTEPYVEETEYYLIDVAAFFTLGKEELEAMASESGSGIMLLADAETVSDDKKYIYVGPGKGTYKLTPATNGATIAVYNAPVYYRCQAGNDWLRQYVFNSLAGGDNASSSFRIEVTTVRADEVTAEMVYDADLIYMESGQNMFLSSSLSASYIQYVENDLIYGDVNDMSAGVVSAILSRVSDDLMPIIVDYDITKETDTSKYAGTNYQLLAKALLKRDLAGFYEAMNDGTHLIDNLRMYLDGKAGDTDNKEYPDKDDNKYNYVNQNVYVINDVLVSGDFYEYFDGYTAKAGFNDVLTAIEAENTTLAEEDRISLAVSKARAIQYIINYSVGIMGEFNDLTILELQPTANIDSETGGVSSDLHTEVDSKENTKLYWKTESMKTGKQILYSKKPFSIHTDVKSVVEFNGEWEDINSTYDMIFIGLDGKNLNLGDERPRRTVYNNYELNGKVYHLGDESGSGTYDSNDITSQKMMDLLEYLQAGYPIVVENDFFTDGTARDASEETINTEYIADSTVMYHFLSAAVSVEEYKDSIYTVSDTMSNAGFMARMKTSKPRIELVNEDAGDDSETGQEVGIVQRLVMDDNDEYHGRIAFQIKNNRGEDYYGDTTMHLYADMNYDGIFGEEEELGEEFGAYANEGNVIDVAINGMGPGVIPWKLEVTDNGNPYRRASAQGYFELVSANEEQIRVLQVTKSKGDFYIDLEAMCKKKDDSVLARLLKDAEANSNLAFEFEAVTSAELSENLAKNPKYLNLWDIVVLTVDDGVMVDNTALMNYVNDGRSLLVCSQNKGDNSAGLAAEVLGWTSEKRTYVSLGAANQYHRYAGMNSGMYEPGRAGMRADKINEGSILYYPYEMAGSSFSFAEKMAENGTGLRASEYLLNFENNLKSENKETKGAYVTTWLTFGGNSDTAYGISPKDARNNYYCYSKGNVVYLAQSEYPYIYEEGEMAATAMGADECKFFVNALMAAYSAGVHSSDVSVVSGFAQTSTPVKSISVPFDQEWRATADDGTEGILDDTVDVYFKFADSNIGANKKVTVSFYYEDPAGTQEFAVGDTTVKATPFGSDIWTVVDNKLVQVTPGNPQNPDEIGLDPGKVYQIKAPVVSLRMLTDETTNDAGIYVLVESEFTRNGKQYKIDGFATVSLNRAKLFLLE